MLASVLDKGKTSVFNETKKRRLENVFWAGSQNDISDFWREAGRALDVCVGERERDMDRER